MTQKFLGKLQSTHTVKKKQFALKIKEKFNY